MEKNRRSFIKNMTSAVGSAVAVPFLLPQLETQFEVFENEMSQMSSEEISKDESFWDTVRSGYDLSDKFIDLNNGGVSPQPKVVLKALEQYHRTANLVPSYSMWTVMDRGREALRQKLAIVGQCDPECVAIQRNASEALETIIFGLRLKKGDEVILSKQDYPHMINAWKQRQQRDKIVLKWVDLKLPSEDEDYLSDAYINLISSKTKLVHLTHMINWNGQILPVKKIIDAAHEKDVEVLVDGAHSFAQLDYSIAELNCDYFGCSLHKWLGAPFGTGMLYVRSDRIKRLYPFFAAPNPNQDDIRKFEHLGTRSLAIEQAISQAIQFHNMIQVKRKRDRLYYLKSYWTDKISDVSEIKILTPKSKMYSGAIGLMQFKDSDPRLIVNKLRKTYKIHTTNSNFGGIKGVRISPNVYTSLNDLDQLVEAIKDIAS